MIVPCESLEALAAAIKPPRPVIIMTLAGKPVDDQIAALRGILSANDIIIDAGNANFRDTMRRFAELEGSGPHLHRQWASRAVRRARAMVPPSWWAARRILCPRRIRPHRHCRALRRRALRRLARTERRAGHFVKTIHNGIEYADMQMIAEIYGVLRDGLGMAPKEIGKVFGDWNKGRLNSYLIEITAAVLPPTIPRPEFPWST